MSVTVTGEVRGGPGWLGWLVWVTLALLLGVAFWLLLGACGFRMLPGSFCPAPAPARGFAPALGAEIARQHALEAEIERLELTLLRSPACTAPAIEAIPEDAWNRRDLDFLEGCWELDSDYEITNESTLVTIGVASWRTCFDASGRGEQDIVFGDGSACHGPVDAEFGQSSSLVLSDDGDVLCDRGSFIDFIYERVITCERIDAAHARCIARHPETGASSNVNLRRAAPE